MSAARAQRSRLHRGFGRLGWQLTVAFVAVALAAVATALTVTGITTNSFERQVRTESESQETTAVAAAAAAAYGRADRQAMLAAVMAASDRLGAEAQVRDSDGQVLRTSAGFSRLPATGTFRAPVYVGGRKVAAIELKYGSEGLTGVLAKFNAERLSARILAGFAAALLALVVALLLAPRITDPLNRLLRVARARTAGRADARAGDVGGFRDMRQLAATFDEMADAADLQEQLRRNLVADVAHELRTPVAVMQAEAEAMLDGVTTMGPAEIRSLHDEMLRLGRMIESLQQLAAAEAASLQLDLAPFDLADVVRTVAWNLGGTFAKARVNLELRLERTPVRCDWLRMQDVVRNLLTNAVKYTPARGLVLVETRPADDHGLLRVSDTGVGIPAGDLPHVTERFYRGRHPHDVGGSGIGLAVVEELVRAQNGTLEIVSEPGQGTQIAITLPCPGRGGCPAVLAELNRDQSQPESTSTLAP